MFNVFINGLDEWKGCPLGKFVDSCKLEGMANMWRLEKWANRNLMNVLHLGRNNPPVVG